MFDGVSFFVLPSGVGKGRLDLFRRRILANRGKSFDDFRDFFDDVIAARLEREDDRVGSGIGDDRVVVVEDSLSYEIVAKILKLNPALRPSDFRFVGTKWLSESLRENRPMELGNYEIDGVPPPLFSLSSTSLDADAPPPPSLVTDVPPLPRREIVDPLTFSTQRRDVDRNARDVDDDDFANGAPLSKIPKSNPGDDSRSVGGSAVLEPEIDIEEGLSGRRGREGSSLKKSDGSLQLPPGSWLCSQPSAKQNKVEESKNAFVIAQLEELCRVYKTTNDQWRQLSYRKAISGDLRGIVRL